MEQKLCVIEALVLTMLHTKWNWDHYIGLYNCDWINATDFLYLSLNSLIVKKLINNKSYS